MGIKLEEQAMLLTLDEALALARGGEQLNPVWLARVEHLGELGMKTYIAALGGALLAKASNPAVDVLTQDEGGGPNGYSLRRAAEFLTQQNDGRYHLGAQGRWPLNNRPFLGGPSRIDEFTKISSKARPSFEAFKDSLRQLNRLDRRQALEALAAFLRVRMAVQEAEQSASRDARSLSSDVALDDLVGIIDRFVRADPEGGRRAQALVAAVLDCAFEDVLLQPINSPHAGDVRVMREGEVAIAVEVKQLPTREAVASELAREAAGLGADLALLVVIADGQAPIERYRVQRDALRDDGTLLRVCEGVLELVSLVAVLTLTSVRDLEDKLPGALASRLQELEVAPDAQVEWRSLIEDRLQGNL